MRILAIDTSFELVSVALFERDQVVAELDSGSGLGDAAHGNSSGVTGGSAGSGDQMAPGFTKKRSKRGSKTSRVFPPGASVLLAPMLESLMNRVDWKFCEIDLVAVATGPGRFTGLRVGVVTAKSLVYANNSQIIGVNTLEVIAARTAVESGFPKTVIRPVLNAQRDQLFTAGYRSDVPWQVEIIGDQQMMGRDDWLDSLVPGEVVTGPGLKPIEEMVRTRHPEVVVASEDCWNCSATGVGRLAWKQFEAGKRDDLWKLQPLYYRPSSAEELRAKRGN